MKPVLGVKGSIQTGAGSWTDLTSGQFIAGTGWHHVMYTYSDTGNLHTLYIDGLVVASSAIASSIYWTGAGDTYIGSHPTIAFHPTAKIDDVRIYNRALSATDIANLSVDLSLQDSDTVAITVTAVNDAPVLDVTSGLIGRWSFDASAIDSSGNSYNGTLTNGGSISTTPGTSRIGAGNLLLDGSNDYVDLSAYVSSLSGLTTGTIAAWVPHHQQRF